MSCRSPCLDTSDPHVEHETRGGEVLVAHRDEDLVVDRDLPQLCRQVARVVHDWQGIRPAGGVPRERSLGTYPFGSKRGKTPEK